MLFGRVSFPALAALLAVTAGSVQAQGIQNWINNEASKIQQDAATGRISQGQATYLENKDNQIQAQEQRYLNQNGGVLTAGEQQKLGSELRRLNGRTRQTVRKDNPNLYPNPNYPNGYVGTGYPPGAYPPVPNGYIPPNGYVPPNGYSAVPGTHPPGTYPYRRHHHHDGYGNGQYTGSSNGYWGH